MFGLISRLWVFSFLETRSSQHLGSTHLWAEAHCPVPPGGRVTQKIAHGLQKWGCMGTDLSPSLLGPLPGSSCWTELWSGKFLAVGVPVLCGPGLSDASCSEWGAGDGGDVVNQTLQGLRQSLVGGCMVVPVTASFPYCSK